MSVQNTVGGIDSNVDSALGQKTINFFGSFVITVNNLAGPGMLGLPLVYQQSGWLLPTIFLILVCIISSFASTMFCEAMALVPGNSRFQHRLEFATLIKQYYGVKWYIVCQFFYNLSLQILNIASILVSAQVMDEFVVFIFGKSYALQFTPDVAWIDTQVASGTPFEDSGILISLGYMVTLIMLMPMGFLNLDENIYFQYVSWVVLVGCLGEFVWQFIENGLDVTQTPAIGDDQTTVLGVIIFSFTYVVTVPSWCNEKKDNVSVNKAIWISAIVCTIGYIVIGILGAMAYPDLKYANVLTSMGGPDSPVVTRIFVYIFSIGVIGLGIPLFSIYIRYNLYVGGVLGANWSAFWGAVFPWLISFLLYSGEGFTQFENWSALIVNGFINFVVPFIVYIKARQLYAPGSTQQQLDQPNDLVRTDSSFLTRDDFFGTSDPLLSTPSLFIDDPFRHRAVPSEVDQKINYKVLPIGLGVIITIGIVLTIGINIYELF